MPAKANEVGATSMFCDEEKYSSPNITVQVTDLNGIPIEEAQIRFSCGFEGCGIGLTDSNGLLEQSFPECLGGFVHAAKLHEGYLGTFAPLPTNQDYEQQVTLRLKQPQSKKVEVRKFSVRKAANFREVAEGRPEILEGYSWTPEFTLQRLDLKAEAIVNMELFNPSGAGGDDDLFGFSEYCRDIRKECATINISLVPGWYHVDITVLSREDYTIPPDRRCASSGGLPWDDPICFTVPEEPLVFDAKTPFVKGGVKFDTFISQQEIDSGDTLVLKAILFELPAIADEHKKIEDLTEASRIDYYSQNVYGEQRLHPLIMDT